MRNNATDIKKEDLLRYEEAYAGDIIGVFDPGIFSIGDTLCAPSKKFKFDPIPTFAPEHFQRIRSIDTMKRKQFLKGVEQELTKGICAHLAKQSSRFNTKLISPCRQVVFF